jgi:hypothetical protein
MPVVLTSKGKARFCGEGCEVNNDFLTLDIIRVVLLGRVFAEVDEGKIGRAELGCKVSTLRLRE